MSNKKDIFDHFRESEAQLTERPSSDAWRRLEARLDEGQHIQKEHRQASLYRQLLSVAAVAVLLVTVGLVWTLYQNQESKLLGANMPAILEDLSVYETEFREPLKVVEFTRKHVSRLVNPVEEGDIDRKLLPKIVK